MREINLEIVKKDTKVYVLNIKRNGVGVDVSGWTLMFTVKTDFNDLDAAALITVNVVFPNNSDSQNGICYLPLTSANTNIAVGEYFYDIKLIDTNFRETFMLGKLSIVPTIRTT